MLFNLCHNSFGLRVVTLALVSLSLFQSLAVAQQSSSSTRDECLVFYLGGTPFDFEAGETIRIRVSNPDQLSPQAPDDRRFKMLVAPLILDAQGDVIAQLDEILVEPGEVHSFELHHDEMLQSGEPNADRLQVRPGIRCRFFSLLDRTQMTVFEFPATFELINSGRTIAIQRHSFQIISAGRD